MGLLLQMTVAGIAFGLASLLFVEMTEGIRRLVKRYITYPPLAPVVGGLVIIGLTLVLNTQDYLGLSLPLIRGMSKRRKSAKLP